MNSVIPCDKGAECSWPACADDCEGRPGRICYWNGDRYVPPEEINKAFMAARTAVYAYLNCDAAWPITWLLVAYEANQK